MNREVLLNFKINSELMNFIDLFGDMTEFISDVYIPLFMDSDEYKDVYRSLVSIKEEHQEFASLVFANMNINININEFTANYKTLFHLLQNKCIHVGDILRFMDRFDINTAHNFYHLSTKGLNEYSGFIENLYNHIHHFKNTIHHLTNHKVRVYSSPGIYYKILDDLLNILILLDNKLQNYRDLVSPPIVGVNLTMGKEVYEGVLNDADLLLCQIILLYKCIDQENFIVKENKYYLSRDDVLLSPKISLLMDKNNYIV